MQILPAEDLANFLRPKATPERLFDYRLRSDILSALTHQLPNFEGTLLDIGCGKMPYRTLLTSPPSRVSKYIGLDLENGLHGSADLLFDGRTIPIGTGLMDSALATEVLEHCAKPESLLTEVQRVLKPGGFFFFTVPSFWPLHEVPHDYYRYTPFSLRFLLTRAGFECIQIRAHAGADASLAQMIGLWLAYRGMRPWRRWLLSRLLMPVVWLLNRVDQRPTEDFEGAMVTGLSGIARKVRVVDSVRDENSVR